jgi:FkbM family methyltransferase
MRRTVASLGAAARAGAVRLVARLALGGGAASEDRERLAGEVRLAGFRGALRASLLRAWLGREAAVAAPALGGAFTVMVRGDDHGPGAEILRTGVWEPHLAALWPKLVHPGAVVVDVGANLGFHALHAAVLAGPSGRVVAVEPDPANVRLLRLACSLLSGAAPVEVVAAALSDRDGTVILSDLGNAGNSGARFSHPDEARLRGLVHGPAPVFSEVKAVRWDDHFGEVPMGLVKLDVEGYEPVVVRGMAASVARFRPAVVTELAPGNLQGLSDTSSEEYLGWFLARGYRGWVVREPAGALDPLPGPAWRPERHHADILLLPGERLPEWVDAP